MPYHMPFWIFEIPQKIKQTKISAQLTEIAMLKYASIYKYK